MSRLGSLLATTLATAGLVTVAPASVRAADEPGRIITLAGGSHGDGLPAPRAPLAFPRGVAAGTDGYVYISDFFHHRVRRVGPDGTIEAFAGLVPGGGGDGGDALVAGLNRPMGLAFDRAGNLYVADGGNHRVRKITPGRVISTVAGNGSRTFRGDGGPATRASLSFPGDVAVDGDGNVFVADTENNRVRRVDAETGTISTYAGGGTVYNDGAVANTVPIGAPRSVAIAPNDDLYIGAYCQVFRVSARSQTINRVVSGSCGYEGDGGPASSARLGGSVSGLDASFDGRLWISDTDNHVVRVVGVDGTITTVVGNGSTAANFEDGMPALEAAMSNPWGTALDAAGNLYVVDEADVGEEGHDRILKVRPDGTLSVFAGTGTDEAEIRDGDPAKAASFAELQGAAYDDRGRLYVAEAPGGSVGGGRIWRIDPDGRIFLAAGNGKEDPDTAPNVDGPGPKSPITHPLALDVGPDGALYIADVGARQIKRYDPSSGRLTVVAGKKSESLQGNQEETEPALEAQLHFPKGLAVAPNGDVYWSEAGYGALDITRIRRLRGGRVEMVAGTATYDSPGAGFDGDGGPVRDASIGDVHGLAFDAAGNLLIADTTNSRIRKVDARTGTITTVAGDGAGTNRVGTIDVLSSFTWTDDVVPGPDGGFFVVDSGDRFVDDDFTGPYVDYVSPTGMVSHVAGTGTIDLTEDGPALATPLLQARSAALGPRGLAIVDLHRVRLVTPPEGGWPSPPRQVVCLPNQLDKEGDSRTRIVFGFESPTHPSADLLESTVVTQGNDLVATLRVKDLDAVMTSVRYDPQFVQAAWALMIWSPDIPAINMGTQAPATRWRYLGAFHPLDLDDPAKVGQFAFDYGSWRLATGIDERNGTAESYTLRRLGSATGSADFVKDTLTIRVPLANLGLEAGDVITYQNALAGGQTQRPAINGGIDKPIQIGDAMPPGQIRRSITIGKSCPDGYR